MIPNPRFRFNYFARINSGRWAFILLACLLTSRLAAQVPGLPEPGLVVYGRVVNSKTLTPALPTNLIWQVAGGSDGITVSSRLVVVNSDVYHVTRIPFETRSIGTQNLLRTTGTIGLTVSPTTYQRIATADGAPASILDSSRNTLGTFTFGLTDRGLVERLTLGVATTPIGGGTVTNLVIGTDLSFSPSGGLSFNWPAVNGSSYTVLRSTNVLGPYVAVSPKLVGKPPKLSFSDTNAPLSPELFYRISVTP